MLGPDQIRFWTPNKILETAKEYGLEAVLGMMGPGPQSAIYRFTYEGTTWVVSTTTAAVWWLKGFRAATMINNHESEQ